MTKQELKASDLIIGDKIRIQYAHPKVMDNKLQDIRGEVVDHFGDGVFIRLEKPIQTFDQQKAIANLKIANPMGYPQSNIYKETMFEVYDNEHNDFASFKYIQKISSK